MPMISEFACSTDENIGPPFLEGDGLAHVRSPHFIDLVGDDGSAVRLLLVAPDAMGRASRSLPSPGARGEGSSEPRQRAVAPIFCDNLRRESRTLRFPADKIGQSASGQGPVGPGRRAIAGDGAPLRKRYTPARETRHAQAMTAI